MTGQRYVMPATQSCCIVAFPSSLPFSTPIVVALLHFHQ